MDEFFYTSKLTGRAAIRDYLEHDPGPTFDMKKLSATWIQIYDIYPHVYGYVIPSDYVGEEPGKFYIATLYKKPGLRYFYVSPHDFMSREEAEEEECAFAQSYLDFLFLMDNYPKSE